MNPTLQQIHGLLLAQQNALTKTLDGTTDVDKAKAIVMEMQEILHRIDLIQNLLFTQTSQKLRASLPEITKADAALTQSLQSIENAASFLSATSSFLASVDQAIDLAKTLAV
jgi:hypothetical protein